MSECLVAIHQPNFFPWLGYFDKIRRVDVFILLDDVQFPKTGSGYCNRVQIASNGAAQWLTAPVARAYHGFRTIQEMRFAPSSWRADLVNRLRATYKRTPYFDVVGPALEPLLTNDEDSVADYNAGNLLELASWLGLEHKKIVRSSELNVPFTGTERLIALTLAAGGSAYLSGGGAHGYQDQEMFKRSSVQLRFQDFVHPTYEQFGAAAFLPGLSIIDALVNCGPAAVTDWLTNGGPSV